MTGIEDERFRKLYQKHHKMVRGLIYNMTDQSHLDDLVQEVFLKIWKGLPRFSFLSSEKTWIYRIAINTAVDYLRRPRVEMIELNDEAELHVENNSSEQQDIQAALQCLDEAHRSVLILFYFEDLKIQMIAKILDIPVGTVKSRLSVGRQKLKEILDQEGGLREVSRQEARCV